VPYGLFRMARRPGGSHMAWMLFAYQLFA